MASDGYLGDLKQKVGEILGHRIASDRICQSPSFLVQSSTNCGFKNILGEGRGGKPMAPKQEKYLAYLLLKAWIFHFEFREKNPLVRKKLTPRRSSIPKPRQSPSKSFSIAILVQGRQWLPMISFGDLLGYI